MTESFDFRRFYDHADTFDSEGFASYFSPKGTLRFGDGPVATGPEEIAQALSEFFGSISSMSHVFVRMVRDGQEVALETITTYGRADGRLVEVPAVAMYTFDKDGIAAGRIYSDLSKVFAP
ncbi:nuclear transport factor 2 family protein [Enemella sp. A6]|uniref:nuclear transport factor 2 family protein n=1 Tax=Enemella sp. A6 TaxID=3440152 RepID=UPI003EB6DCCD